MTEQEEADNGAVSEELDKLLKEEEELKKRLTSVEGERAELAKAMDKERQELKRLETEEQK